MIFENLLSRLIHESFDDKLGKYEFSYQRKEEQQRNFCFYYKKQDLILRVKYNYPNEFVDIELYKEKYPNFQKGVESISLQNLMIEKKVGYSYEEYLSVMPNKISIEKSLDILSNWLIEYGHAFLNGSEWKTNRDILGT